MAPAAAKGLFGGQRLIDGLAELLVGLRAGD